MKRLVALGISIGVLAGLFTWFAVTVTSIGSWQAPFVVWIGFAAWACFYAAGGGVPGLSKTLASLVAGALLAFASERVADVIEKHLPARRPDPSLPPAAPA
jgi:xanthine/uracil permease